MTENVERQIEEDFLKDTKNSRLHEYRMEFIRQDIPGIPQKMKGHGILMRLLLNL